ncbi:MAG: IS21 family transposase, partial [Acidobacteria bacterium]|nr:IS21 family transposase [Acidobacteriota bacterium]
GGQDLVLRQNHRPGEKLFVDWAGAKATIHAPQSETATDAPVFVAVLGASNYTYAEATRTQQTADWIGAHTRALEFLDGVPELVVPFNPKTGVTRACRYDPDLNPTYQEWAKHYGVGVLPARPGKPKDKAKVECGVLVAGRWILAALRHRKFFSLAELNQAIGELLTRLNQKPFKKQPGSRASRFAELDQPALRPLPACRFEDAAWTRATVNIDYHVAVDFSFYSVPYRLARKDVDVRATAATVEIFHRGERVASHVRSREPNKAVTIESHRPKAHQAHWEWPPSRMVDWAAKTGPHTASAVDAILKSFPHPEMGYRSCLGVIRLAKKYGDERVEAACQRALLTGTVRYRSIQSILKKQLDRQPLPGQEEPRPAPSHDNIRGPEYFAEGGAL